MSTETYSNPSTNNCPPQPNPCVYEIPITLKVPIRMEIESKVYSQHAAPQLIVVPIQPDLQLTPKVESRQPECVLVPGC